MDGLLVTVIYMDGLESIFLILKVFTDKCFFVFQLLISVFAVIYRNWFLLRCYKACKRVWRFITGTSEIYRLCKAYTKVISKDKSVSLLLDQEKVDPYVALRLGSFGITIR